MLHTKYGAGVPRCHAEAATPFEGGRVDDRPLLVLQEITSESLDAPKNVRDVEAPSTAADPSWRDPVDSTYFSGSQQHHQRIRGYHHASGAGNYHAKLQYLIL